MVLGTLLRTSVENLAERNYSTTEQEALAVVCSIAHWRVYLVGKPFTVICDHRPLR